MRIFRRRGARRDSPAPMSAAAAKRAGADEAIRRSRRARQQAKARRSWRWN